MEFINVSDFREGKMLSFKAKNVVKKRITWKKLSLKDIKKYSEAGAEKEGVFASLKGSMSLEASLVIPVFMFFLMTIILSIKMVKLQSDATEALHQEFAVMFEEASADYFGAAFTEYMNSLKNPYLMVRGGEGGINLVSNSSIDEDGIINIEATYVEKEFTNLIPVNLIYRTVTDRIYGHAFNGYVMGNEEDGGFLEEEYVYVTEKGTRYHRNPDCSFIKIIPKAVDADEVDNLRNNAGGKYYPCARCGHLGAKVYYITDDGTSYHGDAGCPSLKRTVNMITLKEAISNGYLPCSKCG